MRKARCEPVGGLRGDGVRHAALGKVENYCERRVPDHARDQVRLEARMRGDAITIIEHQAPWHSDFGPEWTESKIAQLLYDRPTRTWELFAYDRNTRRIPYPFIAPSRDLDALLTEIDRDPICIFRL